MPLLQKSIESYLFSSSHSNKISICPPLRTFYHPACEISTTRKYQKPTQTAIRVVPINDIHYYNKVIINVLLKSPIQ